MSNSQITSRLTRVTVPQIGDANFVSGIHDAFEIINNNFKNINIRKHCTNHLNATSFHI